MSHLHAAVEAGDGHGGRISSGHGGELSLVDFDKDL